MVHASKQFLQLLDCIIVLILVRSEDAKGGVGSHGHKWRYLREAHRYHLLHLNLLKHAATEKICRIRTHPCKILANSNTFSNGSLTINK